MESELKTVSVKEAIQSEERERPSVSVIMNCYNAETYLREAIDSVRSQTFSDWEIVFWDNQSTDGSASIVQSYNDERIRYFLATNHTTLGEARNLAVAEARGPWLAFLDCDDIWFPAKLERQMALVGESVTSEPPVALVYCGCEIHNEKTGETKYMQSMPLEDLPEGRIITPLLMENFIPLLSALIRKDAFRRIGGVPMTMKCAEDYFIFVAVAELYSVRVVREILARYRLHQNNWTDRLMDEMVAESIFILEKWRDYFPSEEAMAVRIQYLEDYRNMRYYEKTLRYKVKQVVRPMVEYIRTKLRLRA